MGMPTKLESKRLVLRAYTAGDAPVYHAAAKRNREHLARYERGNALMSIRTNEDADAVVRDLVRQWETGECWFYGLFRRDSGEWAGQVVVGLSNPALPEYSVGFIADVNHEGQGYVSEALRAVLAVLFDDLGAHRVRSDCNEANTRSWRLLGRCGFTREGHLRENRKNPDGSFHGDYLYGLLPSEFVADTGARGMPAETTAMAERGGG